MRTRAAASAPTSVSRLITIRLGNDLRALLRLMSMSVQSLRERSTTDAAAERDLIELDGAIDSAFHIAHELIAMDDPRRGPAAVADVNELVLQLEGVLVRMVGGQIRVNLRLDAVDGMVEAEAVQLEWVLLNLLRTPRRHAGWRTVRDPYRVGDATVRRRCLHSCHRHG